LTPVKTGSNTPFRSIPPPRCLPWLLVRERRGVNPTGRSSPSPLYSPPPTPNPSPPPPYPLPTPNPHPPPPPPPSPPPPLFLGLCSSFFIVVIEEILFETGLYPLGFPTVLLVFGQFRLQTLPYPSGFLRHLQCSSFLFGSSQTFVHFLNPGAHISSLDTTTA